jgi:hypothetical protein
MEWRERNGMEKRGGNENRKMKRKGRKSEKNG